jgi:hypothetical protein
MMTDRQELRSSSEAIEQTDSSSSSEAIGQGNVWRYRAFGDWKMIFARYND